MDDFRILKAADSALVIEFGSAIDRKTSDRVLALAEILTNAGLPGATEIVATFRSLSVNYDSLLTTGRELEQAITALVKPPGASSQVRQLWEIPVCYDPAYAPDIAEVAKTVGLTVAEVAALHAGTQYHVYMIGFIPGYPYMGDLPAKLRLPRRLDPRTRVPPGSLAIATSMTAVYPHESPGGWHLIGTSPVRFFDPESAKGALLGPGDAVKFHSVTADEFSRIRLAVETQRLRARQHGDRSVIPVLKVIAPGFHTTIQDQGRRGFQHVGVPVSGALDRNGCLLANALVENPPGAACLEIIGSGPEFEIVASSVRVALVGSGGGLEIGARDSPLVPSGQSVRLTKGEVLRVRLGGDAFSSYLAIEGGFDVPLCLGSRSTYTRAGFGGLSGRPLRSGDILHGYADDVARRDEVTVSEPRSLGLDQAIRVVLGPQDDYFTAAAIEDFLQGIYSITPASDRMGFRLAGPLLVHRGDYNIVSDGIVAGSIQVPGSKLPIVLMADAQTTGGYPKIATVISADLPVLGVRSAGRSVRFQSVSREEAETIRRAEHQRLMKVIREIRPVNARGISLEALYRQNLIDGVVDANV